MIRPNPLDRLRHSVPAVLPSLLLCDFGNLEREVRALEDAKTKYPEAKRLLLVGQEASRLEVPEGIVVQSAVEWLFEKKKDTTDCTDKRRV